MVVADAMEERAEAQVLVLLGSAGFVVATVHHAHLLRLAGS